MGGKTFGGCHVIFFHLTQGNKKGGKNHMVVAKHFSI
jgi:hypothetical protein